MRFCGDLLGLRKGTMIAPEVILVQRFEALAHRNHAGAGGVERNGRDVAAADAGALEHIAGGGGQGRHLVGMGLGGKVRIFAAAMQRVRGRGGSDRAFFAVNKSDANAQCAEVNAGYDGHGMAPSSKRFLVRQPEYTIPRRRVPISAADSSMARSHPCAKNKAQGWEAATFLFPASCS